MAVHDLGAFMVNLLRVRVQDVGGDVADDFHHPLVTVHRIFEILRGVVVFILVGVVVLFHVHAFFHVRMIQVELQRLVVAIEIHVFILF